MNRALLYLVFLAFLIKPVFAQKWENIQFSNLNTDRGLSQSSVTRIFQDSRGFMWFGTRNGLNRWDGVSFTTYFFRDASEINDNHILSICEDRYNNLWVGMSRGLNILNYETGEIKSYTFNRDDSRQATTISNVYALACDNKGRVWIGSKFGIDIYDPATDSTKRIAIEEGSGKNIVRSIVQTRKSTIVVATINKGIIEIDETGEILRHYKKDQATPQILGLCETNDGKIWAGCSNSELWEIDGENINVYKIPANYAEELFLLRSIVCDSLGNLIIGTNNGLFLFDTRTYQFVSFSEISTPSGELNHFSVLDIKIDNAGTLWVGTYATGVSFFNPYNTRFTYYNPVGSKLSSLCILGEMIEDDESNIWITSEGAGLICFDRLKRGYDFYGIKPISAQNYSQNIIKSIYKDGDRLYCGTTRSEVYSFDLKTRQFKLFCRLPGFPKVIYEVIKDSSGHFWIGGTGDGGCLYRTNEYGGNIEAVNVGNMTEDWNVRSIVEVSKNVFLVGTRYHGASLLDMNKKERKEFSASSGDSIMNCNYVTDIFRSSKNNIWIATLGGGIYQFKEQQGVVAQYSSKQGLHDDNVCIISESLDGKLWLASPSSIFRFDPETGESTVYNNKDGMQLLELAPKGVLRSRNGLMLFSGNNGFISFHPNEIKPNRFIPPLYITSLSVNGKGIIPNQQGAILKKSIEFTESIRLAHNQNNLVISFSALNYIYANHNMYKVKLENVNDDWIDIMSQNYVNYVNLSPGDYVFKVKAANNDGVWNEHAAELLVTIDPPYWKTWWAYLIYSLLVSGAIFQLFRMQKRRLRLENRYNIEKMEKDKMQEYHDQNIQYYTYFSHELRTPLSLILAPISDLTNRSGLLPAAYKSSLQLIEKNANRLLLLVNQLMDFRKSESNNLQLRVTENDFVVFMTDICLNFKELAKNHNINLQFHFSRDSLAVFFDVSLFEKLFFNLLSNALKFSKVNGNVTVRVDTYADNIAELNIPADESVKIAHLEGRLLYVSIEDDGVGIAKEDLNKIFNPFFRTQNIEHRTIGSGIGLSFAKSIVKLCKGIIWVESELDKGTKFSLIFPINKNNFHEEEIQYQEEKKTEIEISHDLLPIADNKHSILIVEDNEDLLLYLSNLLQDEFELFTATDGAAGWDIAFSKLPDLIISDVMMPKMNGIDLCRKIKSDINTGHIPIILLTSNVLNMQIQEGFSAGADIYLTKPFQSAELLMRITTLLNNRENLRKVYNKRFSLESLGINVASSDDLFMKRLNKIIQENLSDPALDINVIAKEIGMSRSNLYRKVRALTDDSTVNLIKNIRLRAAQELLEKSNSSITEISIQIGFNSTPYFITTFKKQFGMTPKEYQMRYR